MNERCRENSAQAAYEILDAGFFKALCDQSRLDIVSTLIRIGRADISEIANHCPMDRSVVSRHLKILEAAGIAVSQKQGRRVFYELDGPAVVAKLRGTTDAIEPLISLCCPGNDRK